MSSDIYDELRLIRLAVAGLAARLDQHIAKTELRDAFERCHAEIGAELESVKAACQLAEAATHAANEQRALRDAIESVRRAINNQTGLLERVTEGGQAMRTNPV